MAKTTAALVAESPPAASEQRFPYTGIVVLRNRTPSANRRQRAILCSTLGKPYAGVKQEKTQPTPKLSRFWRSFTCNPRGKMSALISDACERSAKNRTASALGELIHMTS